MNIKTIGLIAVIILAVHLLVLAQDPSASKSSGRMVELSLIVTDKNGKRVGAISKDELRVSENRVEQKILSVDVDKRPLDYGLLIDASGSFRVFVESGIEALQLITANRQPDDEIFLERFVSTERIQLLQDFTKDTNALNEKLKSLKIEGGQSAVIDALYTGAQHLAKHNSNTRTRRKALVIITDGEDRKSARSLSELTRLLREQDIQVFILGIVSALDREPGFVRTSPRERAEKLLNTVAEESGGRVFFAESKEDLREAATQIIDNLHGQFRITYQSSNDKETGFRKVEVKLISNSGEKRVLIAPRGYYPRANEP